MYRCKKSKIFDDIICIIPKWIIFVFCLNKYIDVNMMKKNKTSTIFIEKKVKKNILVVFI